ncbi:MAG TPA: hypothetical protein ENI07_12150 [Desulfobacterales bacterium]|nr:hypothetical protein [Desulfobacterales bacterium]
MKTINRRSFLGKTAGLFGLFFLLPSEVMAESHKQFGQEVTVKIDASGIDRELERLMYKTLGKIQVRASEEGTELLMGR